MPESGPFVELQARCEAFVEAVEPRWIEGSQTVLSQVLIGPSAAWLVAMPNSAEQIELIHGFGRRAVILRAEGITGPKLIEALERELSLVHALTVAFDPVIPVRGGICVSQRMLPRFRSLEYMRWPVLPPRVFARMICHDGSLLYRQRVQLAWEVGQAFAGEKS